ncbi:hypothetical protein FIA58_009970 [Flavobacterium jejuense]|uniref:DUF4468 domain-containing protein n=1 Tax=Flavobacterium jejuense TaxID=1544455 RepID=A0ABX0IQB6_9FLAO|nr:hypothetical protein [Flavobacterium jejuense]NHN26000.1 hypothetical protein [Flavobacterium jejuense]
MKNYILLCLLITFSNQSLFACKCQQIDDIKSDYVSTDAIIHAKVIAKEFVSFASTVNEKGIQLIQSAYHSEKEKIDFLEKDWIIKIKMEIVSVYKGKKLSKYITVYTSRLAATCGYLNFDIGQEYQVYLSNDCYFDHVFKKAALKSKNYNGYWTNVCTRTKTFSLEEDKNLKALMAK